MGSASPKVARALNRKCSTLYHCIYNNMVLTWGPRGTAKQSFEVLYGVHRFYRHDNDCSIPHRRGNRWHSCDKPGQCCRSQGYQSNVYTLATGIHEGTRRARACTIQQGSVFKLAHIGRNLIYTVFFRTEACRTWMTFR